MAPDPSGWKRNLAVFRRVRVSHLHPGIHVEHYRGANGLEHDYIVDPGADPGRIRFTIEGGDRIDLAANGDLLVHAGDDVVRFNKPTIYQQAGQDRDLVEGEYVRAGPAEFRFQIENYDTSRPLIIDPVLSPPTVFGGSDNESLNDVDVDNAGNIYVTGSTRSTDFPTRNPLFPNAAGGGVPRSRKHDFHGLPFAECNAVDPWGQPGRLRGEAERRRRRTAILDFPGAAPPTIRLEQSKLI